MKKKTLLRDICPRFIPSLSECYMLHFTLFLFLFWKKNVEFNIFLFRKLHAKIWLLTLRPRWDSLVLRLPVKISKYAHIKKNNNFPEHRVFVTCADFARVGKEYFSGKK